MAVPKRRRTKTARNMRRSHHFKKPLKVVSCTKCKSPVLPHMACPNCGFYKGREVIDVMKKVEKRERKAKERASQQ